MKIWYLAILLVLGSAALGAAEPAVPLSVRLAYPGASGSALQRAARTIGDVAAAESGGVSVEIVPNAASMSDEDVLNGLRNGSFDVAIVDPRVFARHVPALAILGQPFLFADDDAASRFFGGAGGNRVAELAAQSGVNIGGWFATAAMQIVSKAPIETMEQFEGLRVAVDEYPLTAQAFGGLGAAATAATGAARAAGLETGVFDAAETVLVDAAAGVFPGEFLHIAVTDHRYPYWAICYSNNLRSRVSGETLTTLLDALNQGATVAAGQIATDAGQAIAVLQSRGFTVTFPDRGPFAEPAATATEAAVAGADAAIRREIEALKALKAQDDFSG